MAGISEDNTKLLLKNNVLDLYKQIISPNQLDDILENIGYTLANMLSFSDLKDEIRNHPAFLDLIGAIESPKFKVTRSVESCRVFTWMYSNALFEPYPNIDLAFPMVHYMTNMFVQYPDDREIANETIWGLLKFLQADQFSVERKKMIFDRKALPFVACRINTADSKLQRISLQVLELFCRENTSKEHFDEFLEDMDIIDVVLPDPGSVPIDRQPNQGAEEVCHPNPAPCVRLQSSAAHASHVSETLDHTEQSNSYRPRPRGQD